MKIVSCNVLVLSAILGSIGVASVCEGFSVPGTATLTPSTSTSTSTSTRTTQLQATSRREIFAAATSFTVSAGALVVPFEAAFAEYVPKVQDMQQIYFLGTSLDKLVAKLEDPTQTEAALSGVKQFNKDPSFYNGYAKNYVMKLVRKGSDTDPRTGYIKQASTLISSLEGVLEGGDALMNEKSTGAEAVARVKKAQSLIARFIEECGVEDDKLAAFVAAHK